MGRRGFRRVWDQREIQAIGLLIQPGHSATDSRQRAGCQRRQLQTVLEPAECLAIEAHYFWENGKTLTPYAQTGKVIGVNPGDQLTTIIRFDAKAGTIVASIEDENIPGAGLSAITIVQPIPNEPSLFKSWTDFFQKATAASRVPYVNGTTQLDVETDYLDQQTMCGLLPFTVTKIVMPGVPSTPTAFSTAQLGGFTCKGPLVKLDF